GLTVGGAGSGLESVIYATSKVRSTPSAGQDPSFVASAAFCSIRRRLDAVELHSASCEGGACAGRIKEAGACYHPADDLASWRSSASLTTLSNKRYIALRLLLRCRAE